MGAALAPGFDEREVQADDPSVWALQTATGQRFARVNTLVSELDTVKTVASPTEIIQASDRLLVYSDSLGSVTTVDAARPEDVDGAAQTRTPTPAGTDAVVSSGDWVAYLTTPGEIYVGMVSDGTAAAPRVVDPYREVEVAEDEDRPQFRAVAVSIGDDGRLVAYSADRQAVVVSEDGGESLDVIALADGPDAADAQVTWAGDTWAVLEPETGLLWIENLLEPVATGSTTGARMQAATPSSTAIVIADEYGAISVPLDGGAASRVHGSTELSLGQPAQPVPMPGSGDVVAAWLPAGTGPGTLWLSNGATSALDFADGTLAERRAPVLRSNGSRLVLNESRSGWVWSVPSGALVRSSQAWVGDEDTAQADADREVATQVTEPRAPVARDDAFGVRAGRQVLLPVLLNDVDANADVLTVAADAVEGLDPEFGTVSVADDGQAIVVDVAADAQGTGTFAYAVTDGTADDGLLSRQAQVALTVQPSDVNNPPVWCGVDDCAMRWPSPQVSPGGTVSVDVLSGWVDPEGDPIYLRSATTAATSGVVAASPEGQVFFQHTNANATASGTVPVDVTVADALGATASRGLTVSVLADPQLRVEDVAVTVTAGVTATVDVADQVAGARGPLSVTEASMGLDESAEVSVAEGLVGFTFLAATPGSYLVDFAVADGVAESRAVARVTVIAPEEEQLSTVPLTAFVRSREDATVDVLAAVTNPGGHVLLVSELLVDAEDGAQLSADIVGHSALRLSGDTPDGQPGTLGVVSFEVSDGSGRAQARVRGEITVILLGSESPATPLAVDDAITVRVGTQADIEVLANDVGPAGNVVALDAGSVVADEGAGLAFPAGSRIRYLAPQRPGEYEIEYSAYVLGYPTQLDSARVVVTVLASDTNQAPTPGSLRGRVASGETVRLPFVGTGIDPDGDTVTLRRVETQPASGSATVAPDGQSILYTSDAGFSGQVSFTYAVEDARGLTAIGTAAIGVIAADVDPRPVAYSDYVQAQVGEDRRVRISPLANDIDLAGGELELVGVRPDAPPGSAEYDALADRILGLVDDRVEMSVGEEPGTYAYLYTASNAAGSTAIGRIIVKAVREPVADVPIVADTVLTAETRDTFVTGVDVLTDKVSWGAGDADDLTLSLWGSQPDLTVDGRSIEGPLPENGRLVAFQVDGVNFAGEEVTSYGFLKVPGELEIRVALRDTFEPIQVDEDASVTFDLLDLIALPEGVDVAIDPNGVSASGSRAEASCRFIAGTSVRYSAGRGEPYTDTCLVPVLIDGESDATVLPVPITIIAEVPQPILTGAAIELSPGDTTTFDLATMVSWPPGATARQVEIASTYRDAMFDVARTGTVLTITARSREAIPGRADAVTVSLTSDTATPPVSLTLEVGPAPSELPKGATVAQTCSQASGTGCTVTVIGGPGEVNPLPDVPLELVAVSASASCPTVEFSVAGPGSIRATWNAETPGAVCEATFAVRDAQGRLSAGDRLGSLTIDLQGYPAAPAEVRQVSFGDGTLGLAVSPGPAAAAYPALAGFSIYDGTRQVASCDAAGVCTVVAGTVNGDQRQYVARAFNAVGESRAAVATTAWSYSPPDSLTAVSASPTRTTGAGRQVDLSFTVTDSSTREVLISSATGQPLRHTVAGTGAQTVVGYALGSNIPQEILLTPVTVHPLPPVDGAVANGAAASVQANGVGRPTVTPTSTITYSEPALTGATVRVELGLGGAGSQIDVGVVSGDTCTIQTAGVGAGAVDVTFTGLTPWVQQVRTVCAVSRVPAITGSFGETRVDVTLQPRTQPPTPVVNTPYSVPTTCVPVGDRACEVDLSAVTAPVIQSLTGLEAAWYEIRYFVGSPTATSSTSAFPIAQQHNASAAVYAKWCSTLTPTYCGPAVQLAPSTGTPAYAPRVEYALCERLDGGGASLPAPTTPAAGDIGYAYALYDYDSNPIPADATDFSTLAFAQLSVAFGGRLTGIDQVDFPVLTCTNAATPPPAPEPPASDADASSP